MRTPYLLIVFLLLAFSCNSKKSSQQIDDIGEERLGSIVTEWIGKEIIFPENPVFARYASDTTDYAIPQSQHKVLVYVDSFGCTGCMLQGEMWKGFIKFIDSATNNNLSSV